MDTTDHKTKIDKLVKHLLKHYFTRVRVATTYTLTFFLLLAATPHVVL